MKKTNAFVFLALMYFPVLGQQLSETPGLTIPQRSQRGEVVQTIGLSTVSIVYHSPAVRKRSIWGNLVPYDKVWRCGANENTTIQFSHDAKIEGQPISAGIYGLHMIPGKKNWVIILSSNYTSWGSFSYQKSEDVVRVTVNAKTKEEHSEWLNYGFMDKLEKSAVAYLEWENLRVPFRISFDVEEIVYQNMKNELRTLAAYSKTNHLTAAQYCAQNNFHQDQALVWIELAIKHNPGFASSSTKAVLLMQTGKTEEASNMMKEVLDSGTETELNTYGYQLLGLKQFKEALAIFELNVERHPKSWNVYDSLAEAHGLNGDKDKATKLYKLALKHNPPENQVTRINELLK